MWPIILLLLGMVLVVGGVLAVRLHPFLALVLAAYVVALLTPEPELRRYADAQVELNKMSAVEADRFVARSAPSRVAYEFGVTCAKIGILIAMAAIIGQCLLDSGAAQRIVGSILGAVGAARAQLAFLVSGFLLAIPAFFDTVFYLLVPIAKAMFKKTGENYLLYIMATVAGATMAHSLVPPTPGPLFVAAELNIELPTMIFAGSIVGGIAVIGGYAFACWVNRRWSVPLRDVGGALPGEADVSRQVADDPQSLPSLPLALAPIVVPVVLIAVGSWRDFWFTDKSVALSLGAALALLTLALQKGGAGDQMKAGVQSALMSGGVIILITAAGGAFGGVLRQTGIAVAIQDLGQSAAQAWVLPLAFGITALVRTAQGSATVAMITAVPIAAALAGDSLPYHPVYLALAIGCGSKPIPWMNDSGFWIITRMTGMTESETLRFVSTMMTLMGFIGLGAVMVGAAFFPCRL